MGMLDTTPEALDEKLAQLEAGVLPTEEAPSGEEQTEGEQKPVFQPTKLERGEESANAEDAEDDYHGISVDGVDYKVPQVDVAAATAAREKAAKGEALTDIDKVHLGNLEFKEELDRYGLDWDSITVEYHKGGGNLTEKTYGDLCKVFPKSLVDSYMRGVDSSYASWMGERKKANSAQEEAAKAAEAQRKADGERQKALIMEAAGSEDDFSALNEWAQANVAADELEAVNELLRTADVNSRAGALAIKSCIGGLMSRMRAATSQPGAGILGGSPAVVNPDEGPLTKEAFSKLMRDPRYRKDKQWAASVDRRRLAGITRFKDV